MAGGESRTISASAETVNIVDPRPPRLRKTSSCQYDDANPVAAVDPATTSNPVRYTGRSPRRATSRPPPGAPTSRKNANALITIDDAVAPTPKL
ncbi:MAG: hypothetical protein R2731_01280 [Nocardioides sp.]